MTPEQVNLTIEVMQSAKSRLEEDAILIANQQDEIVRLKGAVSMLGKFVVAVEAHNARCAAECGEGIACGYEGYLKRTKRRCPTCPALYKVDVMPTEGSA